MIDIELMPIRGVMNWPKKKTNWTKLIGKHWNIRSTIPIYRSVTTICLGHPKKNSEVITLKTTKAWKRLVTDATRFILR